MTSEERRDRGPKDSRLYGVKTLAGSYHVLRPYLYLTERAGFDLPSLCKFINKLCLQLNWHEVKDLDSLVHLLFLYGFFYLVMGFKDNLRATFQMHYLNHQTYP